MRGWRVMGMWEDGEQFLVVLGSSPADCGSRLQSALAEYDAADFERMDSLWYESWRPATPWRAGEWYPESLIPLRRWKRRAGRERRESGPPARLYVAATA